MDGFSLPDRLLDTGFDRIDVLTHELPINGYGGGARLVSAENPNHHGSPSGRVSASVRPTCNYRGTKTFTTSKRRKIGRSRQHMPVTWQRSSFGDFRVTV